MIKMLEMDNGKKVKVQLFDTAGQEKFRSIVGSYYKGAQGIVLVYDIASRGSFNEVKNWFEDMQQ